MFAGALAPPRRPPHECAAPVVAAEFAGAPLSEHDVAVAQAYAPDHTVEQVFGGPGGRSDFEQGLPRSPSSPRRAPSVAPAPVVIGIPTESDCVVRGVSGAESQAGRARSRQQRSRHAAVLPRSTLIPIDDPDVSGGRCIRAWQGIPGNQVLIPPPRPRPPRWHPAGP